MSYENRYHNEQSKFKVRPEIEYHGAQPPQLEEEEDLGEIMEHTPNFSTTKKVPKPYNVATGGPYHKIHTQVEERYQEEEADWYQEDDDDVANEEEEADSVVQSRVKLLTVSPEPESPAGSVTVLQTETIDTYKKKKQKKGWKRLSGMLFPNDGFGSGGRMHFAD